MAVAKLNTSFNIEVEFPITPVPRRMVAWLVDAVILIAYLTISNFLFTEISGRAWAAHAGWVSVLLWLPALVYSLICEITLNGQTPGKKILHCKVITNEGGQPTISQYLLRWMFRSVDLPFWLLAAIGQGAWPWYYFIFLFGGLVCILITEKSQRIGDLLAGTMVINTHTEYSWEDTVFTDVEEGYVPKFPQVMKMTDRDMNTLKQVLKTAGSSRDYAYANRVILKVKNALQIESDLDAFDLMEVLLKDYNYLSSR